MKVELTNAQYYALCDIYGPPEDLHYMFMTAASAGQKHIIEGSDEEFDELLNLISEEVGEGICSQKNARHLLSVVKKIDPSSLDSMGM